MGRFNSVQPVTRPWHLGLLGAIAGVLLLAPASLAAEGRACETEPTDEPISYGDVITCAIGPVADTDLFRFQGVAGEKIILQALSLTFNTTVCVELIDPMGMDVPPGTVCGGNPRLDRTLAKTGLYTIVVSESGNDQAMNYRLTLERIYPISPTSKPIRFVPIVDAIDPSNDLDFFHLEGRVGDVMRIHVTSTTFNTSACLELYGPSGAIIGTRACGGGADINPPALTEAGIYTILVDESGHDQAMNYSLAIQCILGPCSTTPPTKTFTVPPCRVVDTRVIGEPIPANGSRSFLVAGTLSGQGGAADCNVPRGPARAAHLNVVAVTPDAPGHLKVYPYSVPEPLASTVNFTTGQTVANGVLVPICDLAFSSCPFDITVTMGPAASDVVIDVSGYVAPKP